MFSYQWKWDQSKAPRYMTVSANGMTVSNKTPGSPEGFGHIFGDTQLAHGAAWSIRFEKWGVYVTTFVTDSAVIETALEYGYSVASNARLNYWNLFNTLRGGRGTARGNNDVPIELIHYLDLLNRKLIIINKECPSERVHVTYLFADIVNSFNNLDLYI